MTRYRFGGPQTVELLDQLKDMISADTGVPVDELRTKRDPHPADPGDIVIVTDGECDHWPDYQLPEQET